MSAHSRRRHTASSGRSRPSKRPPVRQRHCSWSPSSGEWTYSSESEAAAERKAAEVNAAARRQAQQTLEEAEAEAARIIGDARNERIRLVGELARERSVLEETRTRLSGFLTDALEEVESATQSEAATVQHLDEARAVRTSSGHH